MKTKLKFFRINRHTALALAVIAALLTVTTALAAAAGALDPTFDGDQYFALDNDLCSGRTLVPSGTCIFNVTSSPLSPGTKTGSVSIPSNAPTSPDSISLSRTGVGSGVGLSSASHDFGSQQVGTTSGTFRFTVTNTGNANLVMGSLTFTSDWILSNDTCSSANVIPSGTCTFDVAFHPLAAGRLTGTIGIPSNAFTSPDSVALSGTGIAPTVGLSDTSLDFDYQEVGTTSAAQTVTLTNTGTANLMVGSLTFTSDWILSNDTCSGATVVPSGTCTFDVAFHPLATGPLTGTIGIPSNAASSPDTVELTGTGYTKLTSTFRSTGTQDGWILESTETSGVGGTLDSAAATFRLGDDNTKKQYRGILSFSTGAGLPDDAVITKVTLKVKKQGITGGGNPVTTFQGFMVDIKKGFFGTTALQTGDFQAAASKSYGPFMTALSGGWYSIDLTSGKGYINKLSSASGLTQIRLRFKLDDNNNTVANYLSLYSGNAAAASRPQLIIEYYVP